MRKGVSATIETGRSSFLGVLCLLISQKHNFLKTGIRTTAAAA
ncbi:hypothetical protein SpAn4DRAFT_4731 [Sporomusa ovata]|uniref:Uncharacterized protein n=1 Tax=Sporomusa ovata TaxID=2378 RepID=A0A0U1KX99_9FIRM|nr:hypothetical protein SpAn4DRAFT_4731 [Sporomusa ovata]